MAKKTKKAPKRGKPFPRRPTLRESMLARCEALGWSRYRLGKEAGINPVIVNRFLNGDGGMTHENIERVLVALGFDGVAWNDKGIGERSDAA